MEEGRGKEGEGGRRREVHEGGREGGREGEGVRGRKKERDREGEGEKGREREVGRGCLCS